MRVLLSLAVLLFVLPNNALSQLCGAPKHLHLAVGKDPSTSMTVSFASPPCKDSKSVTPTGAVMYGPSPDQLDSIVTADMPPRRYDAILKHLRKNTTEPYYSDYFHHIRITGLKPNTKYYYRSVVLPGDFEAEQMIEKQAANKYGGKEEEDEEEDASRLLLTTVNDSQRPTTDRQLYTSVKPTGSKVFLTSNESLHSGDRISLPSYGVNLRQQGDGNLVLYKENDEGSKSIWNAKLVAETNKYFAILQDDGNLLIQSGTTAHPGPVLWKTGKTGEIGDYFLAYSHTRNGLHITSGTPHKPGSVIWTSNKGGIIVPPPPPEMKGSFTTAPPPGEGHVTLAFIGDMSHTGRTKDTMSVLHRHHDKYSAVILVGDLAYPADNPTNWDKWFDMLDDYPAFMNVPLQIAPGNHDIDIHPHNSEVYVAYEERFLMPQIQEAIKKPYAGEAEIYMHHVPYPLDYDYGNAFYSFIYGPSLNIVVSSYSDFQPGSIQYQWLVRELQSVDRTVTPWVLVTLHCPIYNTFTVHTQDIQVLKSKEILEPLFIEYKVNVVFAGHVHAYMRTVPVANGTVDASAPVHIIIGDGGREAFAPFQQEEPEEWVASRDSTYYGYGSFDMINRTHAQWSWVHTAQEDIYNYVVDKKGTELPPAGVDDGYIVNQFYL